MMTVLDVYPNEIRRLIDEAITHFIAPNATLA
jgi:hypothetical protein